MRSIFQKIMREPLTHFLVVGVVIFAVYQVIAARTGGEIERGTIVVDRASLVTFLQSRMNLFEPKIAAVRFNALTAEQKTQLTNDYIRDEALVREAERLKLSDGDYDIRKRLTQKLEFILENAGQGAEPSDQELAAFLEAHNSECAASAMSFAQIFLESVLTDPNSSLSRANALRDKLNRAGALSEQALTQGDRFSGGASFASATPNVVTPVFGKDMTAALFALEVDPARWQGPLQSPSGFHLFLIADKQPAIAPDLAQNRVAAAQCFKAWRIRQGEDEKIKQIIAGYRIDMRPDALDVSK